MAKHIASHKKKKKKLNVFLVSIVSFDKHHKFIRNLYPYRFYKFILLTSRLNKLINELQIIATKMYDKLFTCYFSLSHCHFFALCLSIEILKLNIKPNSDKYVTVLMILSFKRIEDSTES